MVELHTIYLHYNRVYTYTSHYILTLHTIYLHYTIHTYTTLYILTLDTILW